MFEHSKKVFTISALLLSLTACGGSGSSANSGVSTNPTPPQAPPPTPVSPPISDNSWVPGEFAAASEFEGRCHAPRADRGDLPGSFQDEKMWLRSWSHETYLWYDEIEDRNPDIFTTPQSYFEVLKTTEAAKDNFHFYQPTEEFEAFSQSGVDVGYGLDWALVKTFPPREIVVSVVQPGTNADSAGVRRGDRLESINGVDAIRGNDVDILNEAIFPSNENQSYDFRFRRVDGSAYTVTLTTQAVSDLFVYDPQVFETGAGNVGYVRFDAFQRPAQERLIESFEAFVDLNVTELILDVRYNSGGLLAMASQLAYMIAGPAQTNGRTFETLQFNDKNPNTDAVTGETLSPTPFFDRAIDFDAGVFTDETLPSLGLTRLYVITTEDSCSATESLMNSLRGIDIEVVQIGGQTCGKPYGFYPTDNCGTTYFTIQFQGVNDKGFGDYANGFRPVESPQFDDQLPGCNVGDDFTNALGFENEGMLAAAMTRLLSGECPVVAERAGKTPDTTVSDDKSGLSIMDTRYRSILTENKIGIPVRERQQ